VFGYTKGDATVWKNEPLEHFARDAEVMANWHDDFWPRMETRLPEDLGHRGTAPWRVK
jgi:hypothetical protein